MTDAPTPPKVKPLEWTVFDAWTMWAETPFGRYNIDDIGGDNEPWGVLLKRDGKTIRYVDEDGDDWGHWPSVDIAKTHAQEDYEARILSALDHWRASND